MQDARRTIENQAGDCDDKVTLLCSLLAVNGFMPRFVCGGYTQDVMAHVWCEVYCDWREEWVPLDPTSETAVPGWTQYFPWRLEWEIF